MTRKLTHFSRLKPLDVGRLLSLLREKFKDFFEIDKLASEATTDPSVQKLTVTSTNNRTWSVKYRCNCTEEQVVERLTRELKKNSSCNTSFRK